MLVPHIHAYIKFPKIGVMDVVVLENEPRSSARKLSVLKH